MVDGSEGFGKSGCALAPYFQNPFRKVVGWFFRLGLLCFWFHVVTSSPSSRFDFTKVW